MIFEAGLPDLLCKRNTLLYYLIRNGPVTRADLMELTGVSQPTITLWLKELMAADLVREVGISSDGPALGRPRVLVELNPDAAYVGAMHITSRSAEVGLVNIKGETIASDTMRWDVVELSYSKALLEKLTKQLMDWSAQIGLPNHKMLGLGVATSGPIDNKLGLVASYSLVDGRWMRETFPIRRILQQCVPFPIFMETNAWAIALGERWFGRGYNNFVTIHVHEGIGAGTILNGQLYKGAGLAGELFSVNVTLENPQSQLRGQRHNINNIVARSKIIARLSDIKGYTGITEVVQAALRNEKEAVSVLMDCAEGIATICSPIANLLDLDAFVLSGPIFGVPAVVNYIQDYMHKCTFSANMEGRAPLVVEAMFKQNAGLVGAASLVYDQIFHHGNKAPFIYTDQIKPMFPS
jgi:predicted NBD/HSP70 family sugar kinase